MKDIRDFKVIVEQNIGENSIKWFGEVGNTLSVVNNKLIDKEGQDWSDLGVCSLFEKERRINKCFGYNYDYKCISIAQTVFKVIYEDPKRESEELRAKIEELESKLKTIRSITEPIEREYDDSMKLGIN